MNWKYLWKERDQKSGTPFCNFTNRCHIDGEKSHNSYRSKPYKFRRFILFLNNRLSKFVIIPKLHGELPQSLFYAFIAQNTVIFFEKFKGKT